MGLHGVRRDSDDPRDTYIIEPHREESNSDVSEGLIVTGVIVFGVLVIGALTVLTAKFLGLF